MPRQLRIEYPGAFYHVYSRGNQKQAIFFSDEDRYFFLKILRDAHERHNLVIHLYCLMDSHYHLTLETPEANLSRIMHFINSAYSIHLNTKHGRCGHLFQGRFKAILVQADAYARTLTCYIHANPVVKSIVDRPEKYAWSSCQDYFGLRKPPPWLSRRVIMGSFGGSVEILIQEHERYLQTPGGPATETDLKKASRVGIWGNPDFIDEIRRAYLTDRMEHPDSELCELRRLRVRPDLSLIEAEFQRELGANNRHSKKFTIFLAHKNANYRLREIGGYFGISPAAASTSFHRAEREVDSNETLRRTIDRVRDRLLSEEKNPAKG
jgi:REP element-mobilizing transposase RayT